MALGLGCVQPDVPVPYTGPVRSGSPRGRAGPSHVILDGRFVTKSVKKEGMQISSLPRINGRRNNLQRAANRGPEDQRLTAMHPGSSGLCREERGKQMFKSKKPGKGLGNGSEWATGDIFTGKLERNPDRFGRLVDFFFPPSSLPLLLTLLPLPSPQRTNN